MKTVTLLLVGLVLTTQTYAQTDAISRFFNKYSEDESFTMVTVTSKMFSLFADLDAEDPLEKEAMDAISKLKGLKILALEDSTKSAGLYKEASRMIPQNEFEELMTIRHEDMDMKFMIKEGSNGVITELLMIGGGVKEFFILDLVGEIDLSQISKLSSKMRIDGFEHLRHIDKDDDDKN